MPTLGHPVAAMFIQNKKALNFEWILNAYNTFTYFPRI